MKKIVFGIICAFLLTGCGTQKTIPVKNIKQSPFYTKDLEETEKMEEVATATGDMFEIKKGVLVRYKGGYKKALRIELPETVKEIGSKAFSLTKKERKNKMAFKVSSIEIPQNVKLRENAFYGTGPLKVELKDGRTKVEKRAFSDMGKYGCESEIFMGESIKVIEEYAFYEEDGIKKVKLNNNLERIEECGLYGAVHSDLPDSIKYLGNRSLGYTDKQLTKLPENLEYIGKYCITLYSGKIRVPASVKELAVNAIEWECTNADSQGYDVDENNPYYKSDSNGWLYSKDGKVLYYAYRLATEDNIVIPKGVEKVYKYGIYTYSDDLAPGDEVKIIRQR